jgi:hypothetical protein
MGYDVIMFRSRKKMHERDFRRFAMNGHSVFVAIVALGLGIGIGARPALAADDPRSNNAPPKVNKEADELNTRNPRVFHAGPGKPMAGGVWVAPSSVPKKPAADAK